MSTIAPRTASRSQIARSAVAAASRATHSTGNVRAIHLKNPNQSPNVAWTSVATMAERWQAVFEKSAIGVALTDADSRFLVVNRAYEKLLGYTEDELRKLSFLDITPEEFRESNRGLAKELWAGNREQYELEKPYRHKETGSVRGLATESLSLYDRRPLDPGRRHTLMIRGVRLP